MHIREDIFALTTAFLGKPTIDLFASRLNYKVKRCCAWQPDPACIDSFSLDWGREQLVYVSPFQYHSQGTAETPGGGGGGGHFTPKRVGVRGPRSEFSPQPVYPRNEFYPNLSIQIFTKMTQKEWLNMKTSQILPKESGSKRKNDTQQEFVWHLNTQPMSYLRWKTGSKGRHIPTDSDRGTRTPWGRN